VEGRRRAKIELGPLDGPAIERLVAKVLDGPVEQSVLRRAADTSAGNPLYARELVLGAIDEGRLTLEAIGADVYAMEAAAGAARCFVAQGRMDSARRAAVRARELHAADQGTEPPAIDGPDAAAVELTPREAQIAALAARGLTSHEIADELVLSVRTVETYVYRAMQKRGVANRREL
jgi:DNA-binding NarL/FixJ family response regulator